MKIKGNEVYWKSDNGNIAITFSQFALGNQYKVYHARNLEIEDGGYYTYWEYVNSFGTYGESLRYANNIPDIKLYA